MPKHRKKPKKSTGKRRKLTPLQEVMKWALTPNLPLGTLPWYPNLDSLLKAAANDPQDVIAALPPWLRVLLSEDDERILIEAFTTTTRRNVMIHSKSVLKLINALLSRESKPPPPWMA